jgi:hypothetical protein
VSAGWHLLSATYDGVTGKLYLDGVQIAADTFTPPPSSSLAFNIGHYYGGGFGWNGAIDEVRLYNRALSAAEIAQLFNPGGGGGGQTLIGYWPFDEGSGTTTADTSGSGYNGVLSGTAWTVGKINAALSFNGSAGVVTPAIALGNTFSISTWVNPAAVSQTPYGRIAETRYDSGFFLGLSSSGNRFKFIVNTGVTGSCGAAFGCAEGGTVSAGWHLVTGTYDGTTGRLYVDGALVASDTFTAPANTNLPLYIGRYFGGGYGWNGAIDEVRLYNKALSAAEIGQLFNSGGGGGTPTLAGHWPFDEGSGTAAADTSGNGHNGVVSGATWTTGKVNSALNFNGASSIVTTSTIALGNTFTISAWVNPAILAQSSFARIAETRYDNGFYLGMNVSGTAYKFIVSAGSGATGSCGAFYGCAEGGTVTAGWHLVTATFDGTQARLYVDAILVATETFTAPGTTNIPLYIGRYSLGSYAWNGAIDEVRLYTVALSATEITALFTNPGA